MTTTPAEPPLSWPEQLRPGDELRIRVVDPATARLTPLSTHVQASAGSAAHVVLLGLVRVQHPVELGALVARGGARGRVRGLAGQWAWVQWLAQEAHAPTTLRVDDLTVITEE